MISNTEKYELVSLLKDELELETIDELSEDQILLLIEEKVLSYIENDRDLLNSYLYRLDIDQNKIKAAMQITNIVPPEKSLALLIYYRQLERIRSKRIYKSPPIDDDSAW